MDKVLLITGGSCGIGAAVAEEAVKQGYAVCINYNRNQQKANLLCNKLLAMGGNAIAVKADITQEQEIFSLFAHCQAKLGRLTALVNNAGVIAPIAKLEQITAERIKNLFDVNVVASFLCAKEAIKVMSHALGGHGGAIVNVSSVAAKLGSPNEFIDYAASKGAIDSFTIGLAKEVADIGIRVNAVRPGLIDTDLHAHAGDPERPNKLKSAIPMQRPGSAEEVAKTIVWLLSDDASYVTGSILDVSGGR